MKIPRMSRSAVRRLLAAGPETRRFVAEAWLGAPLVELSVALLGLRRTLSWIEAAAPRPRGRSVGVEEGEGIVNAVYRAHFVDGRCLPQSLLQYWLHRRDGTRARFVMGVRRPGGSSTDPIEAHAWVEPVRDAGAPPVGAAPFAEIAAYQAGGGAP